MSPSLTPNGMGSLESCISPLNELLGCTVQASYKQLFL